MMLLNSFSLHLLADVLFVALLLGRFSPVITKVTRSSTKLLTSFKISSKGIHLLLHNSSSKLGTISSLCAQQVYEVLLLKAKLGGELGARKQTNKNHLSVKSFG
jgi:hypothetical protein